VKTKTWTVVQNTGKRADFICGSEKKEIQRPAHINARDFEHWLAPDSQIDENALLSLFKR
jgi:hypothetical protein